MLFHKDVLGGEHGAIVPWHRGVVLFFVLCFLIVPVDGCEVPHLERAKLSFAL